MKPTRAAGFPKPNRGRGGGRLLFLTVELFFCLAAGKRCPESVRGPDDLSPTLPWCPEGQPHWGSQMAKRALRSRNLNSPRVPPTPAPAPAKPPSSVPCSCAKHLFSRLPLSLLGHWMSCLETMMLQTFSLFFPLLNVFIWLCWAFVAECGLSSSFGERELLSNWSTQASHL